MNADRVRADNPAGVKLRPRRGSIVRGDLSAPDTLDACLNCSTA
jgi:hypothetical protein